MADVLHQGEPMVARIGKMTYEDFELASDVKMLDHHFVDPKGRTVRVKSFYRIEPGEFHERNQRKEGVPEPEKPKGEGKHRHFWEKILCDIQLPLPNSGLDPIEPIGGHIRYHPEGAWYGPFEVFNKRHCPDDRVIVHCHVHTDGSAYQPFQTFSCMKEKMRELYKQRNDPWGPDWYIAQPALSRQIRSLEVELRQALFLRNGRGVTLTPAGTRLLAHARGILQQVESAKADLDESRTAPVGRVAIALPPTVGRVLSGPLVTEFRERFPRADISIVEGLTVHILEWIALGRVDIGVVFNPPASPAIELRPLAEQQLCLIGTPPDKRNDRGESVELRRLPGYPLIIPSRPHTIRMLVDSRLAALGLKPTIALEVDGIRAIVDLVQRGHGHAVLPRNALIEAGGGAKLVARPIVKPNLRSVMAIAASAQRPLTRMAHESIALLLQLGPPLLKS